MEINSANQETGNGQYETLIGYLNMFLRLLLFEPRHEISNNVVCVTSKASDQPAPDQSLC